MDVLICEDDEAIFEIISIVVEDMGYKWKGATNAAELLAIAKKNQPKLMVIDYWLGQIKADALIEDLKKLPNTSNSKILLISATFHLKEIAASLAVDDSLEKPFDIVTLQERISNLINS